MMYEREESRFEIMEHIGVLSAYKTGWKREINIVSWNGNAPKYDIRDWDPDHERMSRGITLSEKEMGRVRQMLDERDRSPKGQGIQLQDQKRKWSDEEERRRREP